MKTCVVQAYGLGNAILTTPLVQALRIAGHEVDVFVDKKRAAWPVFEGWSELGQLRDLGTAQENGEDAYDVAVFAHPAGYHKDLLRYESLLEPDVSPVAGKDYMWWFTKHEVETLVDMARGLGFSGAPPPLYLPMPKELPTCPPDSVAIGIGYLKQEDHRWEGKHWGNANYIELCKALVAAGLTPVLVGDGADQVDAKIIVQGVGPGIHNTCGELPLLQVFGVVSQCLAYVGNDSGNMHVAAACNIPTLGLFGMTNAVKNAPWCKRGRAMEGATVTAVLGHLGEWGVF